MIISNCMLYTAVYRLICFSVLEKTVTKVIMLYIICTLMMSTVETCDDVTSWETTCPCNCSCSRQNSDAKLVIECSSDECNSQQLLQQLNETLYNCSSSILKSVSSLQLSINKPALLNRIPEGICQFGSLIELRLYYSLGLTEIESVCFTKMKNLKIFVVNGGLLTSLPDNLFAGLINLETIDFQYNSITNLDPKLFEGLPQLTDITFRYNHITDLLPELFNPLANLAQLETIDFQNNALHSIDCWPLLLKVCKNVLLNGNRISTFTNKSNTSFNCDELRATRRLINFSDNHIAHISDLIDGWGVPGGKISCLITASGINFDFSNNPFNCDCIDFDIYSDMKTSKQMDKTVGTIYCQSPSELSGKQLTKLFNKMDVFTCNFPDHCPDGCFCEIFPTFIAAALIVYCNSEISALPNTLPALPQKRFQPYTYVINITNNKINKLDNHMYLIQTSRLILTDNLLNYIDTEAWKYLSNAQVIQLESNQLTALPSDAQQVKLEKLQQIHLYNNPWTCDCNTLWMKQWLKNLGEAVINKDNISCHGQSMISLPDEQFCPTSSPITSYITIVVPSVVGAYFLLALVIIFIVYAKRHWLFVKYSLHLFDVDECNGEEMFYDAFFSYANEDEQNILELIDMLEEKYSYKACYHRRDFEPGVASVENVQRAIMRSKRTVCYVTENFLQSEWCLWEFNTALGLDLKYKRRRLIAIKDVSLDNITNLPIKSYLSSYTYIEYPSPYCTINILYWLPQHRMRQQYAVNADINETSRLIT